MKYEELIARISKLERNIAILPAGSITKKTLRGNDYFLS